MDEKVTSQDNQKLGLALSGGGFRAAFFHIGVLAQMAEQGLLKQVEVISTVSGGSIIGALYYLHLRNLLCEKCDAKITDDDYIKIVKEIETDFLVGVQKNIRCQAYANFCKNLQMHRQNYSISDRLGELYDKYFYQPKHEHQPEDKAIKPIKMKDLKICPKLADGTINNNFDPHTSNGSRYAKVPILLINTTTLNCGHNWRFEATRMGEPPMACKVQCDVDKNLRLVRPKSYDDIISQQQDFELGLAVAASACVPGIFYPMAISDLYPNIRIQLVDGGVHDNQGIDGLIEEGCSLMVISDGSAQMSDVDNPNTWALSVLARMNNILMNRLREEQLFYIFRNYTSDRIALCHMREGLEPSIVFPFIDDKGSLYAGIYQVCGKSPVNGIDEKVQDSISKIRTDLDSFTDIEANSLMMEGYLISKETLNKATEIKKIQTQPPLPTQPWKFLEIKELLEKPNNDYLVQLDVSRFKFFKIFHYWSELHPTLSCIINCLLLLLFLFLSILALYKYRFIIHFLSFLTITLAGIYLLIRLSFKVKSLKFLRKIIQFLSSYIIEVPIALLKWVFVCPNLFLDKLYRNKIGKIDRTSRTNQERRNA